MRIGLLTYHHVVNAGSTMQAFCGYRLIQSLFSKAEIELVNYYPEASQRYNQDRHSGSALQQEMDAFLRSHCRFSPFQLTNDNLAQAQARIREREYDLLFTGSDTVFQVDGYLGQPIAGPPAPNLYYLPGDLAPRKVGLSISFDPPQAIGSKLAETLRSHLDDFEFIFFRDAHAEACLDQLGVGEERRAYLPDPTLMADLHVLVPNGDEGPHRGAVGVSISCPRARASAIRFAESIGFPTIDLMHPPAPPQQRKQRSLLSFLRGEKCNRNFLDRPSVYRHLAGLITDRFHGSIFAMQTGSYPVVGIELAANYPDRHGKLWDLNDRLGRVETVIRAGDGEIGSPALARAWEAAAAAPLETKQRLAVLRAEGFRNLDRWAKRRAG